MFLSMNLVTALKSSSYLSSSNYLALSMPALGLYINFFSKVWYIYCCCLFKNFKYPHLAYYSLIHLLNPV